jgi:hypothetical protein
VFDDVGEATLVVELRDSVANEVLALRPRRAADAAFPIDVNANVGSGFD